jgi:hypothetical protein
MGIDTDRWVIYLLERAEDGGLYGARVFEDPGDGGRIILDAGVLSPSSIGASEPAQLGLRSRIQVILNHEITEAAGARFFNLPRDIQGVLQSHEFTVRNAPFSLYAEKMDPQALRYLRRWLSQGPYNGIR